MYKIINMENECIENIGIISITKIRMFLRDLKTNDVFYGVITFFQKIDVDDAKVGGYIYPTNKIKIVNEENYNVK